MIASAGTKLPVVSCQLPVDAGHPVQATGNSQLAIQEQWQPEILAFCCNYCAYAAADLAGSKRMQYAPNVRI
ncbi:MAG: hydrogenase iron-sulfur subunit, partial [Tepidisphaeraceae bacterium]